MVGEVIGDRYALEELVGSGGMSSVYRAHDRLLERDVALKILHSSYREDEEAIERFHREAHAVARLSHPNIVTVIDRGDEDGRQFIVFEYVGGETLKNYLGRRGPLPPREALEIAADIGDGLAYAHRQGIIHRDVKPQNVILNGGGSAKVMDFGIARSMDVETRLTQSGTVIGTGDYIAPEQASGGPVVPASDVYSLGCLLFELLTGSPPYAGAGFVDVAMQHIHAPVPDVRERRKDVPPRVAAAVERALAKDPKGRFASMDDFVAELRACLSAPEAEAAHEAPTTVVPRHPPPRRRQKAVSPGPPPRRRPRAGTVAPIVGALLVAGMVAAFVALSRDGGPLASHASDKPVKISGVTSYDPPPGNGDEHSEDAPNATDGDPSTYWTTESYSASLAQLGKQGVGLVLDAGRPVGISKVRLVSDTPGFAAEIRTGGSSGGPFDHVAAGAETVGSRTTFETDGDKARYWLVWITALNGVAHVNEVTAR